MHIRTITSSVLISKPIRLVRLQSRGDIVLCIIRNGVFLCSCLRKLRYHKPWKSLMANLRHLPPKLTHSPQAHQMAPSATESSDVFVWTRGHAYPAHPVTKSFGDHIVLNIDPPEGNAPSSAGYLKLCRPIDGRGSRHGLPAPLLLPDATYQIRQGSW